MEDQVMTATMSPYGELRLHEVLTLARRRKGLTQKAVAKQLGVSQGTVSKWESPKSDLVPDPFELRLFAEITEEDRLLDLRVLPSRWTDELPLAA